MQVNTCNSGSPIEIISWDLLIKFPIKIQVNDLSLAITVLHLLLRVSETGYSIGFCSSGATYTLYKTYQPASLLLPHSPSYGYDRHSFFSHFVLYLYSLFFRSTKLLFLLYFTADLEAVVQVLQHCKFAFRNIIWFLVDSNDISSRKQPAERDTEADTSIYPMAA